jgi:hypothetical protein
MNLYMPGTLYNKYLRLNNECSPRALLFTYISKTRTGLLLYVNFNHFPITDNIFMLRITKSVEDYGREVSEEGPRRTS